jgi:hypothetical protein
MTIKEVKGSLNKPIYCILSAVLWHSNCELNLTVTPNHKALRNFGNRTDHHFGIKNLFAYRAKLLFQKFNFHYTLRACALQCLYSYRQARLSDFVAEPVTNIYQFNQCFRKEIFHYAKVCV